MSDYIWFALIFGGPLLLAVLFLYGRGHTFGRQLDPKLRREQAEGTRRTYEAPEED